MSDSKFEEKHSLEPIAALRFEEARLTVCSPLPQPTEECLGRDSFSGAVQMHQVTETLI